MILYRWIQKEITNYCIRFGHSLWSANQLQAQEDNAHDCNIHTREAEIVFGSTSYFNHCLQKSVVQTTISTIRILQYNMCIFYERSYVKINDWLLKINSRNIYMYIYIKVAYSMWFVRNEISKSRNTWVDVDSPTIFLFWKNVRKRYDYIIISIRCSRFCRAKKRT